MSKSENKNTFFGGAAVLAVGVALTKIIGAIYKIPLINILSNAAYSDFSSAYTIYTFFLTISTAGLPVALSKTISEANALGRRNQAKKVFNVAFLTFLALGLFSFFCMSVLAGPMASLVVRNAKAVYCVLALAPSVLCVCVMAAFRGYFQGNFNMIPTSVSQIIESLFKLVIGLGLAVFITGLDLQPTDFGERMPAVGAIVGVSAGSIVALVYLTLTYLRYQRNRKFGSDRPDSSKRIFISLLKLAIPITLGSGANALITLIDGSLVMTQLQRFYEIDQNMDAVAALDAARALKGIYDKTISIYNLPFSMMVPLTACIIPAVSAALARRDWKESQRISESALRVGLLLALPMGMGLFVLGGPIMDLLAHGIDISIAGPLLSILGIASIFVSLQLLCNSILQANGIVNLPILVVVIGGVVKIVVNYTLVGNHDILINGAPVGTLCCFLIISLLDIFIIRKAIPAAPCFAHAIAKPLLASVIMAGMVWASHGLLTNFFHLGNTISTIFAIGVGVVVYLVLVLVLKIISKEDLELMPKGNEIAKFLHLT